MQKLISPAPWAMHALSHFISHIMWTAAQNYLAISSQLNVPFGIDWHWLRGSSEIPSVKGNSWHLYELTSSCEFVQMLRYHNRLELMKNERMPMIIYGYDILCERNSWVREITYCQNSASAEWPNSITGVYVWHGSNAECYTTSLTMKWPMGDSWKSL